MVSNDLPDLTLVSAIVIVAIIVVTPMARAWGIARRERKRTIFPDLGDAPYGDPGGWRPERPQEWVSEPQVTLLRVMMGIAVIFALAVALLAGLYFLFVQKAHAHDLWIGNSGLRNAAGEFCCGEGDCFVVPSTRVRTMADGYHVLGVLGAEVIPYSEAQPSPDGAYWRCKRPDGSRRCFFFPPSSM